MKPVWKKLTLGGGLLLVIPTSILGLLASCGTVTGTAATGARLERMQASPQWRGDHFDNELKRVDGSATEMFSQFLTSSEQVVPERKIEILERKRADFAAPPESGLRVTWLGHSTFLVELDGQRVLVDPMYGERASPVSFAGPKRWYAPPLPLSELPELDAVLISHDHYDHLDYPTVLAMRETDTKWIVPLGIGAHLEHWGIPAERIVELDWWEDTRVGQLTVTCTPSRHFSGRSLFTQNSTLWAGWALAGPEHRVFYSGDTALHPDFEAIGQKLGPFDLSIMETGAYDTLWSDVHLGPEQAVIAHQLVGAKVMLPVHWGLFNLANHGWTEPIQRVLLAAEQTGVVVVAPRPGGSVEPTKGAFVDEWWDKTVAWKRVAERPAWSTSVEKLQKPSVLFSKDAR